jgi:hypothetical protein
LFAVKFRDPGQARIPVLVESSGGDSVPNLKFPGGKVTNSETAAFRSTSWVRQSCLVLFLSFCGAVSALCQQITGTIVGTVKDPQSALVNTATVKATNNSTGFTRSASTNEYGQYRIQYLPVGTYTLEVNAPNFEKFVQQSVVLEVDQTQTVDITLTVGAESQTITVTEAPPLVNTATVEIGRTINPQEIIDLPLVNRNAYEELSLTPGVQSNSASQSSNPNGTPNFTIGVPSTDVVINGGVDEGTPMVSFYLDGGLNMMGARNYGNQLPNPDALEEFRVETNNYSAQYGRMGGGVVTAVTKSGTNKFHGSLFEFNRNSDFNAYSWNPPKDPVTGKFILTPYHRNNFGGTAGGPIRHDKAFFFFSYAGLRQVIGQELTGALPPTAAERLGDFTAIYPGNTPPPGQKNATLYMPGQYPGNKNGPGGTALPVVVLTGSNSGPGCSAPNTPNCIPTSMLDKTAANLISQLKIPLPTITSGSLAGEWSGWYSAPTTDNEFLGKYNQVLGDKDNISITYFTINTLNGAYGNGNIPWSVNQNYGRQQNLNLSGVHTFSATRANQVWIEFMRIGAGRVNLPTTPLSSFGSSYTTQGVTALPSFSVSGFMSGGGALAGPASNTDLYSLRDVFSMTKGKNSIDVGGELALEKDPIAGNLENFGAFTFNPSGPDSSTPSSANASLADLMMGLVNSMEQDTPYHALMSKWDIGAFFQDAYRIVPRLTLNLGIRYDVETPMYESSNLTATFEPGVQSTVVPNAPTGMLFTGDSGVGRGPVPIRWYHVSPRLGVAWDPFGDGKTAIRAGAGIFYGMIAANQWNQPANAQPFAVRQTFPDIASLTNPYGTTLPDGVSSSFPGGDPFPYIYNPKSPHFLSPAGIETISMNYRWPLTYQLNMAVERQLPGNVGVTAAYVGSLSHDIPFTSDANYPVWNSSATTSNYNNRRPYDAGVLGQVQYLESPVTASYHALQISARRPMTHSLMLSGFYVFSKSFESADGTATGIGGATQDYDNLWEERGPTDFDRRHMAVISGTWDIDYVHNANPVLKELANGWNISPVVTLYSGAPVNMLTGINENDDSYGNNRPDLVASVSPWLSPHRCRVCNSANSIATQGWFNTAAFTKNGPGVTGGIGPGGADGNTPRNYLRTPGYRDIDLALLRDIHFERGIIFQIRGEAINAFNLVSLNGPTANLNSGSDGFISTAASPRVMQVGARLTF